MPWRGSLAGAGEKEEAQLFHIGVSPHIRDSDTTTSIMGWVIIALLPVAAYSIYVCGWSAVVTISFSILGAVAAEYVIQRYRRMHVTLYDLSAVLTGLLLALTLPPRLPFWMPLVGGAVAIALGKQVFGGLGHNIFNPALVGRAVLFISWSKYMTTSYLSSPQAAVVNTGAIRSINAVTNATPLLTMHQVHKGELAFDATRYYGPLLFGNPWGCIGEVSAALLLLGLAVLLYKRLVAWQIPVCYVGTVMVLSRLLGQDPLFAALAGGLLIGACFMATDYVTNPMTSWGKVVFSVGCGIVTVVLRFYSNLPEGVMFAILFMNGMTPLIDRYVKPRPYGTKLGKAAEEL